MLALEKVLHLKINNNQPHNGCRPRKLKRKKRQRVNFETKRDFEEINYFDVLKE